jgi:streptomycin 6-kinase
VSVTIPERLRREWRREADWLDELPQLVARCAERWGLRLELPVDTPHSLVVPAGDVVLKVNAPSHYEADHEADALAHWDGRGAVRLIARDDERRAFLIERCVPGRKLGDHDPEVMAALLARLWAAPAAPNPYRSLADEAAAWAESVPRRYEEGGRPFARSLLSLAVDVFRSVDASAAAFVNQDLHGGNVLSATREPWLVIDAKPLVGEREANAVGPLRNAARHGAGAVRRWLDVLEELGLDRERMRGWGVAHTLAWGWDSEGRWFARSVEAARTIFAAR